MGEKHMGVVEERARKWRELLEVARLFSSCVLRRYQKASIVVFGSVARGDFNEWSDIDVLVVVDEELPSKPPERLDAIYECLKSYPLVEPVVITLSEFHRMLSKKNPLIIEAVEKGIPLEDKLNIFSSQKAQQASAPS